MSKTFDRDAVWLTRSCVEISSLVNDAKAARSETTMEMKAMVADARVEQAGKMVDIAGGCGGFGC